MSGEKFVNVKFTLDKRSLHNSEEIKRKYWKQGYRYAYKGDRNTGRFVMGELCKYSDQVTIIGELENCAKFYQPEEILEIMESLRDIEVGEVNQLSSYSLEKILEILQMEYRLSDKCFRVAKLELLYRGLLDWNSMVCFGHCLERSPEFYAEMAAIIYKNDEGKSATEISSTEESVNSIYQLFYKAKFCPAEKDGKVDKDELFLWIEQFRTLLKQQNQESLFTHLLGRVLAFSPIGEDNRYPCEAVREAIEVYGDKDLENAYEVCVYNQRGMHSLSGGKAERTLACKYKENANVLRVQYPKVASIYDRLCENYVHEADREREREEYEGI